MKVLVTGGTGFVGPRVIHALRAEGREVRALVRNPERADQLAAWDVELARGDVTDPASLRAAMRDCTHVVHLVSVIQGKPDDFRRVMVQGTADLLTAAQEAGVQRFALMSALGTSEQTKDTVPYYGAKWAMEQATRASGVEHVVVRPSFVFGRHGGALPTFVRQVRWSPVVTVIGPGTQRSAPIWVDDVAAVFARALDHPQAANRTFEIGGPDRVTWDELYLRIARTLGKRRRLLHVPFAVARTGALAIERLPGAPLTADQVTMLAGPDNVPSNDDATETFQLPLVPLDEQLRRAA